MEVLPRTIKRHMFTAHGVRNALVVRLLRTPKTPLRNTDGEDFFTFLLRTCSQNFPRRYPCCGSRFPKIDTRWSHGVETFSYNIKDPYVAFMSLRLRLCLLAMLALARAAYKRVLLPQLCLSLPSHRLQRKAETLPKMLLRTDYVVPCSGSLP